MKPDPITSPIAYITKVVASEFKLPVRTITMPDQFKAYIPARHAAWFVARLLSHHSTSELARRFKRDPRSFSYGVARCWERMLEDSAVRNRVEAALRHLIPIYAQQAPCIEAAIGSEEGGPEVATLPIPTLAVGAANE